MNNPLATQTITHLPAEHVYKTVVTTLPNGKSYPQLFQLVLNENGEEDWQLVDEKLKAIDEKRAEMAARFAKTGTFPDNWDEPTTEVLNLKDGETERTLASGGITRINMRRILLLNLGDPQAIIQQRRLDTQRQERFKRDPAFLSTLYLMAKSSGGVWKRASDFLDPAYPDTLL